MTDNKPMTDEHLEALVEAHNEACPISPKADPGQFQTIALDPPWSETGGGKSKRGADRHYPVLKTHEITAAILRSPLWRPAPICHVWMWSTINHLPSALNVLKALGVRYVTHAVWAKGSEVTVINDKPLYALEKLGLGQYFRCIHELLLFGAIGRTKGLSSSVPSIFFAPRGRHSEKPDAAYDDVIRKISPGPRAELFARGPREGWHTWGMVDGKEEVWR